MVRIDDHHLLYIEPDGPQSGTPVDDELTLGMEGLLKQAKQGTRWRGVHSCSCGVRSDSCDFILPGGMITNSLAPHYLRYHRDQVPRSELAKLAVLLQTAGQR